LSLCLEIFHFEGVPWLPFALLPTVLFKDYCWLEPLKPRFHISIASIRHGQPRPYHLNPLPQACKARLKVYCKALELFQTSPPQFKVSNQSLKSIKVLRLHYVLGSAFSGEDTKYQFLQPTIQPSISPSSTTQPLIQGKPSTPHSKISPSAFASATLSRYHHLHPYCSCLFLWIATLEHVTDRVLKAADISSSRQPIYAVFSARQLKVKQELLLQRLTSGAFIAQLNDIESRSAFFDLETQI
jgi:hypothetical protein